MKNMLHVLRRRILKYLCPNCMTLGRFVANPDGLPTERRYARCSCRYGKYWVDPESSTMSDFSAEFLVNRKFHIWYGRLESASVFFFATMISVVAKLILTKQFSNVDFVLIMCGMVYFYFIYYRFIHWSHKVLEIITNK